MPARDARRGGGDEDARAGDSATQLALLDAEAARDGEVLPPAAAPQPEWRTPSEAELDALVVEVKAAHAELQASVRTTVDKAVALGRVLLKAKERLGHGWFLNWLERNTKIKRGMAAKYMILARGQQEYVKRDFQRIKNLGVAKGAAELTRWYREEREAEREEQEQEREEAATPVVRPEPRGALLEAPPPAPEPPPAAVPPSAPVTNQSWRAPERVCSTALCHFARYIPETTPEAVAQAILGEQRYAIELVAVAGRFLDELRAILAGAEAGGDGEAA